MERYCHDPMSGFTFTLAGYQDLFGVLQFVSRPEWYEHVKKDLPIFLVSGAEDPVGAYGKGPEEVCEKLQKAGCTRVSLKLYEGMRHEILNEIGKEEVYRDLAAFFQEILAG